METKELIPISEENGKRAVSARELHAFLESKQDFSEWIKNRIRKYGFIENEDFTLHKIMERGYSGAQTKIEYALSMDMAKELSMVEGNEKGKLARRYFIECERKFRQGTNQNRNDLLEYVNHRFETIENKQLSIEGKGLSKELLERNVSMNDLHEMVGSDFLNWANQFFTDKRGSCDKLISRKEMYDDFKKFTGIRHWKPNMFYKSLKVYCISNSKIITLNPIPLCNNGNRIFLTIGKMTNPIEFFYIQTKEKINIFV